MTWPVSHTQTRIFCVWVLSKFYVAIFYTFREISRQRALRSDRPGPVHRFKNGPKNVFLFF